MDKIETTTSSLDRHFKNIEERTSKLEEIVKSNTNAIKEVKGEATAFQEKIEVSIKSNATKIKMLVLKWPFLRKWWN